MPLARFAAITAGVNVLLFALGSHGDVHPFVGVGIRLKQRGHHVAVAANEYFKPLIDHAGLEFIQCGTTDEYTKLASNPDLWHPRKSVNAVFGGTARYLRPIFEIARDFGQRDDAVIAASSLAIGARVAQDKYGLRLATVHLSPSIFQSVHEPPNVIPFSWLQWAPRAVLRGLWSIVNHVVDGVVAAPLNALRAELSLPPVRNIIRDYWHSPRRVIGMFPDWFGAKPPDWPTHVTLTGFPLYDEPEVNPISPELDAFLRAGEPPIAFTPGSAMWIGQKFFETSVQACALLKRRGLLLTRHRDHLPATLPPGVIHVHYAPFSQLLPRCAAFVHHAGIGSTAQALAAGVPQLATPFTHDQPDNTARLLRLGVAKTLSPRRYTPHRAARMLEELISSPIIAERCKSVAKRFEGVDAIGQTCELIEST